MKKIFALILFGSLFTFFNITAQDTMVKKSYFDSIVKNSDSLKILKSSPAKTVEADRKSYTPEETATLIIVVAFFLIMIILLLKFFEHLKHHKQRIGYQSIKLIGLILIFPGVCVLALIGGKEILSGETLAVLLGTIAGYVLSREDESKDTPSREAVIKIEEEYQAKIKVLEDTIQSIKDKNPNIKL